MDQHYPEAPAWTRRGFLGLTAGAALGAYGRSLGLAAEVPSTFDGSKEECRARLMLFGEAALYRTLNEYVEYYHHERTHQGKGMSCSCLLSAGAQPMEV